VNILWKSSDLSSNDSLFVVKIRSRAEIQGVFESSFAQAWRACGAMPMTESRSLNQKLVSRRASRNRMPQKKRPVRGDNRTGRAIWALGVDGRSRLI
jgi:hypothetical protein